MISRIAVISSIALVVIVGVLDTANADTHASDSRPDTISSRVVFVDRDNKPLKKFKLRVSLEVKCCYKRASGEVAYCTMTPALVDSTKWDFTIKPPADYSSNEPLRLTMSTDPLMADWEQVTIPLVEWVNNVPTLIAEDEIRIYRPERISEDVRASYFDKANSLFEVQDDMALAYLLEATRDSDEAAFQSALSICKEWRRPDLQYYVLQQRVYGKHHDIKDFFITADEEVFYYVSTGNTNVGTIWFPGFMNVGSDVPEWWETEVILLGTSGRQLPLSQTGERVVAELKALAELAAVAGLSNEECQDYATICRILPFDDTAREKGIRAMQLALNTSDTSELIRRWSAESSLSLCDSLFSSPEVINDGEIRVYKLPHKRLDSPEHF